MPKFSYKAKKGPNETVDGIIEAENPDRAIEKVVQMGLSPVDVSLAKQKEERTFQKKKSSSFSLYRGVKTFEISIFTRQLSDLIEAGVPLLRALNVVYDQTDKPVFKDIVDKMRTSVKDGGTLSDALAQHPEVFPTLYSNMIRSGEIGGNLGLILSRLAEFADKDQEIRAKVRSSLIYPALMLVVGILTIFVLFSFVIPRLTAMFDDLAQTLPLPTVILMGVSSFFERFWWLIIALICLAFFYFRKFTNSKEGRLWFDSLKLRMPLLGSFIEDVDIGRFARTLGTLLDSGVVIVSALESVWAVLENEVIKEEIKKASEEVSGGASLSVALKKCAHFPETARSMVAVGEESGHLEHALYKLADSYERRSDRSVKTVTSLIEPLLIVVIGLIVGFIVIAMLLPIFKMNLIIQ